MKTFVQKHCVRVNDTPLNKHNDYIHVQSVLGFLLSCRTSWHTSDLGAPMASVVCFYDVVCVLFVLMILLFFVLGAFYFSVCVVE